MLQKKLETTREILTQFGFSPDTGLYLGERFPAEYSNDICEMITIDPVEFSKDITPGWVVEEIQPEKLATEESQDSEQSASVPDLEEFTVKKKRRGKRIEVPGDEKKTICFDFAQWYNSVTKHEYYGIIHPCTIEKDSAEVVYISIDAVYVDKQVKTRSNPAIVKDQTTDSTKKETKSKKAGKAGKGNEEEKRIGHMNIKVESASSSYYITSIDTDESFKQLVAVIMNNGLYRKYMIFMTDGELAINDKIKTYCGQWKYQVELDWIHLEHKCYDRLSNAIKGKRVPDPRGETKYYKKGPKKGQIKEQEYTSQSRLYARAVTRILWPGNVDEAICFLKNINKNAIKNQEELDKLITYLNNKKSWIPCYAMRKKAGLKNSSNGVEGQNNMNVADRQKNNEASWRPEGSSYLAALQTLFDNHEDDEWFHQGKIAFKISDRSLTNNVI